MHPSAMVKIWEPCELTLTASGQYANPYMDVDVWIDLKGPGFEKRVYGFWDGGNTFRIRYTATTPGSGRISAAAPCMMQACADYPAALPQQTGARRRRKQIPRVKESFVPARMDTALYIPTAAAFL